MRVLDIEKVQLMCYKAYIRLGFKFVLFVLKVTNVCILKVLAKANVLQCVSGLPDKAAPVLLSCRIWGQHQCQAFS